MSLILEALRKSEAERRRGEAPDLRVELPPPPPPKRRASVLAWLAGGLAVAVLMAWLWPPNGQGGVATDGDALRTEAGEAAASLEGDDVDGQQDTAGHDRYRAADVAPRGGAADGDDTRAVFPAVERIEVPGGMAARAAEEAAQAEDAVLAAAGDGQAPAGQSAPRATPPPPPTSASPSAPAPAPAPASASASASTSPSAPAPAPARPYVQAPTARSNPATPAAPLSGDTAIRITGLPSGQRERLPEARVSLHMWNEDPARRFAVIDGQRRIEGDRLGEATIVAIDREGVLLDLEGQLVRLPLP